MGMVMVMMVVGMLVVMVMIVHCIFLRIFKQLMSLEKIGQRHGNHMRAPLLGKHAALGHADQQQVI